MRFDSLKAWNDAAQSVGANRDVMIALAGVFVVLPVFTLAMLWPVPEPPQGGTLQQWYDLLVPYYLETWPQYLAAVAVLAIGCLTMLALFTDRARPTVGEAIRIGARAAPVVILAQIAIGMGLELALALAIVLARLTGIAMLATLAAVAAPIALIWVWTRLSLLAPAVMVDTIRNPLGAIARSWRLTRGNGARLLGFYLLLLIAAFVSMMLVQIVVGIVAGLALPAMAARVAGEFVASVLQAAMVVYFIAVIAACHRQLAGADR